MKQVTFAKPMAPFGIGDKRLVPDDVAADLKGKGYLSASVSWPPKTAAAQPPSRPMGLPDNRLIRR